MVCYQVLQEGVIDLDSLYVDYRLACVVGDLFVEDGLTR